MFRWKKRKKSHYAVVPYYKGELVEQLMRDDLAFPPMSSWKDALKYVLLTIIGKLVRFTATQKQLDQIYGDMVAYARMHCPDEQTLHEHLNGINELWPKLRQKLLHNAGLVAYMNDLGSHSLSFARFPASLVPRATALESSFGTNYDNAGIYRELAPGCISMRSAAKEPIFVFTRERTALVVQTIMRLFTALATCVKVPAQRKLARIIDCGAGTFLEFRKFGFTLAQILSLDIIACDMDETLRQDLDVIFRHDFGISFAETGIDYRICRMETMFADEKLHGTADLVMMDGILSYCADEKQLEEYIRGACRLLRSDSGVITCDLQVMHPTLIRCALVQGWDSPMKPELTAGRAIRKMQRIAKKLNLSLYYQVDQRNPSPLGVYFELTPRSPIGY